MLKRKVYDELIDSGFREITEGCGSWTDTDDESLMNLLRSKDSD